MKNICIFCFQVDILSKSSWFNHLCGLHNTTANTHQFTVVHRLAPAWTALTFVLPQDAVSTFFQHFIFNISKAAVEETVLFQPFNIFHENSIELRHEEHCEVNAFVLFFLLPFHCASLYFYSEGHTMVFTLSEQSGRWQ